MSGVATERSALLRVVVAAVVWGTVPLLVRATEAHPIVIVFYRVFFAGLVLTGVTLVTGRLRLIRLIPGRKRFAIMGMGLLLSVNWILFFTAITLVDVSVAVLLAYVGPVFVALLNPVVNGDGFDRRVLVPLALSLGGTVLIVGAGRISLGGPQALGAALAFLSALTYAGLVTNSKRLIADVDQIAYMTIEYVIASIVLAPALLFLAGPASLGEVTALATLGVVHTALTGFLILSALKRARADHVAVLTYAEPVSAVLFAAAFLGESLTLSTLAGGAAVIAGGAMVAGFRSAASVEGPPVLLGATDRPGPPAPEREDT